MTQFPRARDDALESPRKLRYAAQHKGHLGEMAMRIARLVPDRLRTIAEVRESLGEARIEAGDFSEVMGGVNG